MIPASMVALAQGAAPALDRGPGALAAASDVPAMRAYTRERVTDRVCEELGRLVPLA